MRRLRPAPIRPAPHDRGLGLREWGMARHRTLPTEAVVLVEGDSDAAAVSRLAALRGRDLAAEHIDVVSMGGATNIARYLETYGPPGRDLRVAGLCDVAELPYSIRGAERAGMGTDLTPVQMADLGFHVCHDDLEDELIRSIGVTEMERFIDAQGDLERFRTFQNQPAQRDRPVEAHLHRFIGTKATRKVRWAPLMVKVAVELDAVPTPLDDLLLRV